MNKLPFNLEIEIYSFLRPKIEIKEKMNIEDNEWFIRACYNCYNVYAFVKYDVHPGMPCGMKEIPIEKKNYFAWDTYELIINFKV